MPRQNFFEQLKNEIARIDSVKTAKRNEKIIEGFTDEKSPKALVGGKEVRIFNSNDYLGLRHNPKLKEAEHAASQKYGAGPGAVRFISGTLKVHRDLEEKTAKFHNREACQIFSSAFAANLGSIFPLIQGQSKDSVVDSDVVVISDALNHRSIIDSIRLAKLTSEQKQIFEHMNIDDLDRVLKENVGKFKRALIITDGIFSMLGEYQHLKKMREVVDKYDSEYENGILIVMDDAHGVGAFGPTGRGVEEVENAQVDVLVGTYGKGFGADGGYVVANQTIIDYLRESAATYIYSNPFAPGTAGAALRSLELIDEQEGKDLLKNVAKNIAYFKEKMLADGFKFAVDSSHSIQPVLIGDPAKTRALVDFMFSKNVLVTQISYPVVPKGADEIRVQISAAHQREDLDYLIDSFKEAKQNSLV